MTGGGAGLLGPEAEFVPFSVKDDTIHGNVTINGLTTVWFGIIRSTVDHNVVLEVPTVTTHGMSPAPQLGDAVEGAPPGYGPNAVGAQRVGQCADIAPGG